MKIAISGYYGGKNLGDEAILSAILDSISAKIPNARFHVFSRNPAETSRLFSVDSSPSRLLSIVKTIKAIKGSDAFILGGGGFLHMYSFSAFWMSRPTLALMMKRPVAFYSVGIDRTILQRRIARWLIRRTANRASLIAVRDSSSKEVLEEIGVRREIHVTTDPVFGMKPCSEERTERILADYGLVTPYVLVSPGVPGFAGAKIDSESYRSALASLVDHIVTKLGLRVLLVPFYFPDDLELCTQLKEASVHGKNVQVLKGEHLPNEVLGLFSKSQLAVCARYHANIFAIISGVPFVSIVYHPGKHEPLLRSAGIEKFGVSILDVTPGNLIDIFTEVIESGKEIRRTLAEKKPLLENAANRNADLFVEMMQNF